MRRPGVIARQEREPVFWDQGFLVVVPREGANVIERLPQNDGDEFDFVANRSAQRVAGAKRASMTSLPLSQPARAFGVPVRART